MIGLVLVNVFWGASSIAAKEALIQLTPVEIVTVRFAVAFIAVLALALLFNRDALNVRPADLPVLIFMSVAGVSLQFVLQVMALVYTTVTNFSLLFNLSAIFIMIFGVLLLKERPSGKQALGALIGFGGVFLIVTGGSGGLSLAHLSGDLLGLASAALFGLYAIASKTVADRYGPLTILIYTFLFGILGLLPVYYFATPMTPLAALTPLSWASIGFLAVCCSVIAFLIFNHGLSRLPSADVGITIYVSPLAGVALAVLLLGETLTTFTIAGAALVMAGLYVTQAREGGHSGEEEAKEKADRPATADG
ncbi:DMT family transporter [Methanocella arvoryzae]|uniref:EamA domain-containing protein n=1 Tax=Methanocella arvoryzae (strain DSM 22066 / NBRC 105507 / MRE50) TaxID=351160 RepID=Q0W557_METAR|nr:DMT family transporter [Methanocella arvoryzae]CAJ36486.1 conserved hypothetical protein [Methanocella arvoryzae MRE50]